MKLDKEIPKAFDDQTNTQLDHKVKINSLATVTTEVINNLIYKSNYGRYQVSILVKMDKLSNKIKIFKTISVQG